MPKSTPGFSEVEPGRWVQVTHTEGDAEAQLFGTSSIYTRNQKLDYKVPTPSGHFAGGVGFVRFMKWLWRR